MAFNEFIVEKIGMSRTVSVPSVPVTLLRVLDMKVCETYEDGTALIAYPQGKKTNKPIQGQQKKYELPEDFNKFVKLGAENSEAGKDLNVESLASAGIVQSTFFTKGRGFSGAIKRWGFAGGPKSHGSRFKRRVGSIGNAEFPGRVQKGQKMPGQYGNEKVSVKNDVVSFDAENRILVIKGSVSGANGKLGRIKVIK